MPAEYIVGTVLILGALIAGVCVHKNACQKAVDLARLKMQERQENRDRLERIERDGWRGIDADKVKRIATLEGQLAEKDSRIATLEGQLAEKDSRIAELVQRIARYEGIMARTNIAGQVIDKKK